MKQIGFFDESNRLKELSALRDPLEKLNRVIDWRMFEGTLNKVFAKGAKRRGRTTTLQLPANVQDFDPSAVVQYFG
ncbi:MAG: hypothetical protein ACOX54_08400 [Christensenellales bacterium]|jgi:hypothetical protein